MTDSFWDIDFAGFKKAKSEIDAEIAQLIETIAKEGPAQVDDLVDRNDVLRSIQGALDTLDQKLAALMRHGVEALSDQDKQVALSALEGVKQLLTLMKKISRENLPTDGTLSHAVYGKRETNGVPDWNL